MSHSASSTSDGGGTEMVPGAKSGPAAIVPGVHVQTLIVGAAPRLRLLAGESTGFVNLVSRTQGIQAVMWNEARISVVTGDPGRELHFQPEIDPETARFLSHERKREGAGFGDPGFSVWEGEYEPVVFTKRALVRFITDHSAGNAELEAAVKQLKIRETTTTEETMLDLDTDNVRRLEEERAETNIPKEFELTMPLTEGVQARVRFRAELFRPDKNDYEYRNDKTKRIAVRAANGRSVMRDLMLGILAQLPEEIPRFYGSAKMLTSTRGEEWA